MAARVIDAKGCLFIGTRQQIWSLINALGGERRGAATIDLKGSKFLILDQSADAKEIVAALKQSR